MPESENISKFESPEDSPGFLLWQISTLWQRQINAGLSPLGLTHVQFVLLATLTWSVRADKVMTQVELASLARTDVMMTSNVLRTLEKKGLILRNPHPTDTRAKSLAVTDKGRDLIVRAIQVVEEIDTAFFNSLNADVSGFNKQLLKLINANKSTEG